MERPSEVTSVTVTDNVQMNPGQHPVRVKRVTFYVGSNGPFVKSYPITAYSDAAVIADMVKEVDTLKAIGALK
jgi:lipopolysaccharide export system protein LptA